MSVACMAEPAYEVTCSSKLVEVRSDFTVPFEPKERKPPLREKTLELRAKLRTALRSLQVAEDEMLFATFSGNRFDLTFDAENMLFYNIGVSAFSDCGKNGVAYLDETGRDFAQNAGLPSDRWGCSYFYTYRAEKQNNVAALFAEKEAVAAWDHIPLDLQIPQSPKRYYTALRKNAGLVTVTGQVPDHASYGLVIELSLPYTAKAVSVMKPLLDGVVCAFHGTDPEAAKVLPLVFGEAAADYLKADKQLALLGQQNYLMPYRGNGSFKWNPADERLKFAQITLRRGPAAISGKLYRW